MESDSPRERRDRDRDRYAARGTSSRKEDKKRRPGRDDEEDRKSHDDDPREKREAENDERSEKVGCLRLSKPVSGILTSCTEGKIRYRSRASQGSKESC